MPEWWYDPIGGFAFQRDLGGLRRVTRFAVMPGPNGMLATSVYRDAWYLLGGVDPMPLEPERVIPAPARMVELCENCWREVAVARGPV